MPTTRHMPCVQPLTIASPQLQEFSFPPDNHLLITKRGQILAWDATGIQSIFRSSNNGIIAARAAQDGSDMLAVADKRVVILHDMKRGQEKSWGLQADGDEVRLLKYSADAKSLFLSTRLTSDIQHYSTERSRMLDEGRLHHSSPIAFTISPSGHLMVSASDGPPTVYLKDMRHNSTPILVEPRASEAAVSVAAFHPERPNIFLLAFRDGAIAAYDATRISRHHNGSLANQHGINKGEIAHMPGLHRATAQSSQKAAITDAAFLTGYKTRAVTVGNDGRCRIIDFADGGVILRTWHATAPMVSVSVLSIKHENSAESKASQLRGSHLLGGPTNTNNLITVGRMDGEIHIYDSVGLLVGQKNVSERGEGVLSVEWVRGQAPKPIIFRSSTLDHAFTPPTSDAAGATAEAAAFSNPQSNIDLTSRHGRHKNFENIGLPTDLRKKRPEPGIAVPHMLAIHPDEFDESTVRYTPMPQKLRPIPESSKEYLDLFSPIKRPGSENGHPPEKRMASPPRSRPKISSQTFIKSPESAPTLPTDSVKPPRNLAPFPSTDSEPPSPENAVELKDVDGRSNASAKAFTSTPTSKRRCALIMSSRRSWSSYMAKHIPTQAERYSNAAILADLRKMRSEQCPGRPGGVLSAFGASKPACLKPTIRPRVDVQTAVPHKHRNHLFTRPNDHVDTDQESVKAHKAYANAHEKQCWPEDSSQGTSLDDHDIWLTSDTDKDDDKRFRRRRLSPSARPPARQTSRSRVDSRSTISTTQRPHDETTISSIGPARQLEIEVDGSTEEDMFTAVETRITPEGTFSPSSKDVREMFPRSSSISPHKKHRKSKDFKRRQNSLKHLDHGLVELAENAINGRQSRSMRARAKAGKSRLGVASVVDKTISVHEDLICVTCQQTRGRVHNLEDEVARLKGEVLTFKLALRRKGLPSASR